MTARPITERQRRALTVLLAEGRITREALDRVAGASNGPDEVRRLRMHLGFELPCQRRVRKDRDGHLTAPGTYWLTNNDRALAARLLAEVQS